MNPTQKPVSSTDEHLPSMADTLRHAALYLLRNGWTQDQFFADSGLHPVHRMVAFPAADVLGAIAVAITGRRFDYPEDIRTECGDYVFAEYRQTVTLLATWLDRDDPDLWNGQLPIDEAPHLVWTWNDHPDQEPGVVIDTLHRVAAELDNTNYQPDPARWAVEYAMRHPAGGETR
jgi:hypothetical protein